MNIDHINNCSIIPPELRSILQANKDGKSRNLWLVQMMKVTVEFSTVSVKNLRAHGSLQHQ